MFIRCDGKGLLQGRPEESVCGAVKYGWDGAGNRKEICLRHGVISIGSGSGYGGS